MTKKDNEDFDNSTKCWICDNDYIDNDVKVRDIYYISGIYRVCAHRDYKINVELNQKIPVVFRNLKNYDSQLIMPELVKFNLKTNVIPNGLEKCMSFSINKKLSFIDSFQFLISSLDSFHKNKLDLVKQKGFYPCEYMSDFKKFKEELPSKEKCYSLLTGKKISDKEYEHVLKVCNKFQMKTTKDHHGLYLKCGILLSADVLEKFRNNSLKKFGLCTGHYLSAPALSWGAMLNMTKVEIELVTDPDMYIVFEKIMRGGFSYISNRYSKASNNYLKSYDPKQKSKHI